MHFQSMKRHNYVPPPVVLWKWYFILVASTTNPYYPAPLELPVGDVFRLSLVETARYVMSQVTVCLFACICKKDDTEVNIFELCK